MGVVEKRSLTLLDVLANCPKPCSSPQYQSLPVWCVVCPWCLVWNCPCDRCSCSPIHFDFWILVVPVGRLHRIYRLAIALRCCHVHQLDSAGMDSAVCRVFVIDFAVCHFVYCGSFLDSTQIDCDYVVVDYFFLWTVSENSNGLDYRCVPAGGLFYWCVIAIETEMRHVCHYYAYVCLWMGLTKHLRAVDGLCCLDADAVVQAMKSGCSIFVDSPEGHVDSLMSIWTLNFVFYAGCARRSLMSPYLREYFGIYSAGNQEVF